MSKMVHIAPCRFCGQTIQFESAPLTEEQEIEEFSARMPGNRMRRGK